MKRGEIPRMFHFFSGSTFARVPEKLMLKHRLNIKLRCLTVPEAVALMRQRAGQYRRSFCIEVTPAIDVQNSLVPGSPWIEVLMASRGEFMCQERGGPYRLLNRCRIGEGATLYHPTAHALFVTFEERLMRYLVGETDAL